MRGTKQSCREGSREKPRKGRQGAVPRGGQTWLAILTKYTPCTKRGRRRARVVADRQRARRAGTGAERTTAGLSLPVSWREGNSRRNTATVQRRARMGATTGFGDKAYDSCESRVYPPGAPPHGSRSRATVACAKSDVDTAGCTAGGVREIHSQGETGRELPKRAFGHGDVPDR